MDALPNLVKNQLDDQACLQSEPNQPALITVGIPFFNAEKYLKLSILSVFAQTFENWHLILIDDGSCDSSLEIAQLFANDPRITVISDGLNRGLAYRLNQVSQMAKTPFLARMDADDLISSHRLRMQFSILDSNDNLDLVATGLISMNDSCEYRGQRFNPWSRATTYSILSQQTGIPHATVLGRTEWFRRNPYRLGFVRAEDLELWVRTNEKDDLNIAFIPNNLYFYREFDSTSAEKVRLSVSSIRRIAEEYPMCQRERIKLNVRLRLLYVVSVLSSLRFFRYGIQKFRNRKRKSHMVLQEQEALDGRDQLRIEILKITDTGEETEYKAPGTNEAVFMPHPPIAER